MARVELVMPKMGESIIEATIISWTKKVGDKVNAEETVLEIATDKVDSEVPSPVTGILTETLYKAGDVVPVGTVIAYFETDLNAAAGDGAPAPAAISEPAVPVPVAQPGAAVFGPAPVAQPAASVFGPAPVAQPAASALSSLLLAEPVEGRIYSPLVMTIAQQEGITGEELKRIPGTGEAGRVTKKDILQYVEAKKKALAAAPTAQTVSQPAVASAAPIAPEPAIVPTAQT
ncbi:MAG: biotin/lipoyl-containing protein, partial [Bacteroidia bacterium]|nr:biotin/lipoyl-containing protein [Bacteroidia bacterium]